MKGTSIKSFVHEKDENTLLNVCKNIANSNLQNTIIIIKGGESSGKGSLIEIMQSLNCGQRVDVQCYSINKHNKGDIMPFYTKKAYGRGLIYISEIRMLETDFANLKQFFFDNRGSSFVIACSSEQNVENITKAMHTIIIELPNTFQLKKRNEHKKFINDCVTEIKKLI